MEVVTVAGKEYAMKCSKRADINAKHLRITSDDIIGLIESKSSEFGLVEALAPVLIMGDFAIEVYKTETTIIIESVFGKSQVL